jgi:UMF1 family MFS transporter
VVTRKRASFKEILGWAMFDFANQAYTLLIITVIFGDLFTRVIVGPSIEDPIDFRFGNLLWSLALSVSYLMVVITGPITGAMMDSSRLRKRFLFISYLSCVVTTALLWLGQPGWVLVTMVLIIASNYSYAMGESFIASFLPGLGPAKDLGWISGVGWGLGYVGGLVATLFAIGLLGEVSAENFNQVRWVGPLAASFFLVTALPTFLWVKDRSPIKHREPNESLVTIAWERMITTRKQITRTLDLRRLYWSIFYMMAALYIVISFAFIYGAQVIGWDESVRTLMFITVQVSATLGAFIFGWLHHPWGAKRTYLFTLGLWILAITAIWQTPTITHLINAITKAQLEAQYVFLFSGILAGLSLGASQSAGRALVGLLTPRGKAGEFFGFWNTVSKAAAIVGLLGLGLLQSLFGLANAIVFCLVLMTMATLVAFSVNLERGSEAARNWHH